MIATLIAAQILGTVLSRSGAPQDRADVYLVSVFSGATLKTTVTTHHGSFAFASLKAGTYGIMVKKGTEACALSGALPLTNDHTAVIVLRLRDWSACTGSAIRFAR